MDKKIFSFSVTNVGYKHIKSEPPKACEDFSSHYDEEDLHICVVADGHGSDNYPRTYKGSKFAVQVCIRQLKQFVKDFNCDEDLEKLLCDKEYEILKQLAKSILNEWYCLVNADAESNPFTEIELEKVTEKYRLRYLSPNKKERKVEKAYGTTLIAFVVTSKYSLGIQIGDGKCVLVDEKGDFLEPIPWDENCEMNITTSICDSNAIEEFRFYISEKKPIAVFCGSDGIDDSYVNMEEVYAFYRTILEIFIENGRSVGEKEILDYMPILTKKGSGDDVSIAMILDISNAKKIAPLLKLQSEYFTLTDEKNKTRQLYKTVSLKIQNLTDQAMQYIKSTELRNNKVQVDINSVDNSIMEHIAKLEEDRKAYEQKIKEISQREDELNRIKAEILKDKVVGIFSEDIDENVVKEYEFSELNLYEDRQEAI